MQTIPIERINMNDRRFCISYPLQDDALLSSIRMEGVIQPLLILDKQPHTIVSGFKRIEAAKELGFTDIPCFVMDMDYKKAMQASIHSNLGRVLNIIEKAYCVDKLFTMDFSEEEISGVMSMISLGFHEKIIKRMRVLANAENFVKDFVLQKNMTMQNVEKLLGFADHEIKDITEMLNRIHTTESMMREILQMLSIMKLKYGNIDFSAIKGMNNIYDLKRSLKYSINPILSGLEEDLSEIKNRCALPPSIDIKVDPFFEKEYIDIRIRANGPEEVKGALLKINSILDAGYIRSIFGLTTY